MAVIKPGSRVLARSAFDELLERRAVTGVQPGHDFPVVWVCPEEEWQAAHAEGREPDGLPWPAEDVRLVEEPESMASWHAAQQA
jgi:hypothetical protein